MDDPRVLSSLTVILANLLFNVFLIGFECYFCSLCSSVIAGSPAFQHIRMYLALYPGVTSVFHSLFLNLLLLSCKCGYSSKLC